MNEIWKDVPQYKGLYQVSNLGRVRSFYGWNGHQIVKRIKIMKLTIQYVNKNYKRYVVNLCNKTFKVHRLVAEAFIPKIEGKNFINHKDFNTLNNCVDNLEWCTQKENIQWNIINKRNKKYSYVDKQKVIDLYKQGITAKKIAQELNVSKSSIVYVISKNNIKRKDYKRKSKYISIRELKNLFNKGISNIEISKIYNIPTNYIARRKYQIKKGEI